MAQWYDINDDSELSKRPTIGKPPDRGYRLYQATRRERVDIAIETMACVLLPMLLVFGLMATVIILL